VAHLYLIAWRFFFFIITDFYQLHYNQGLPPFDEVKAYSIYTRTLERYTILVIVMAKAHKVRALVHTRERSGAPFPQRTTFIYSTEQTTP